MKATTIVLIAGAALASYYLIVKKGLLTDKAVGEVASAGTTTPSLPYGISETKTTEQNLAMANAAISANAQKYVTPITQPASKSSPSTTYYTQVQKAAASGHAQIHTDSEGKTVTVGPTGNIYIKDPVTGKTTYTPGPTTKVLGASRVSSSKSSGSSSAKASATATAAANRSKALSGPKVSAKGKYTAV